MATQLPVAGMSPAPFIVTTFDRDGKLVVLSPASNDAEADKMANDHLIANPDATVSIYQPTRMFATVREVKPVWTARR